MARTRWVVPGQWAGLMQVGGAREVPMQMSGRGQWAGTRCWDWKLRLQWCSVLLHSPLKKEGKEGRNEINPQKGGQLCGLCPPSNTLKAAATLQLQEGLVQGVQADTETCQKRT